MLSLLVIALLTLGSAAVAMALRNLIHSALLLTLNWMGIAAYFLWAGAEFAAFAQILVYIGAVSMIVLFAVLLTRRSRDGEGAPGPASLGRASAAIVTAGIVCGLLIAAVKSADFVAVRDQAPGLTVKQIGQQLMGPQAAALLVVGVILTVALLGAVVIAAKDKSENGR
jgi:NADH:ubiquinone oxidoreductase subunit 6 (subunit J)